MTCSGMLTETKACGKVFSDTQEGEDKDDSTIIYYKVSATNVVHICPLSDKIDTTSQEGLRKRCNRGFCHPCWAALIKLVKPKTHKDAPTTRSQKK